MRITVRLFAVLRDRAGAGEFTLDLPDGSAAAAVGVELSTRFPGLHQHLIRSAYAINRAYAGPDTRLADGDEVALIPPVSGG